MQEIHVNACVIVKCFVIFLEFSSGKLEEAVATDVIVYCELKFKDINTSAWFVE